MLSPWSLEPASTRKPDGALQPARETASILTSGEITRPKQEAEVKDTSELGDTAGASDYSSDQVDRRETILGLLHTVLRRSVVSDSLRPRGL